MSDHSHDHERGGHEVDKLPNARLFNLLFGLSLLVLLSSIGVIQLFNMQVASIENARAQQVPFRLQEYRDEMSALAGGYGSVTVTEDGGEERMTHYMPMAEARRSVLENPHLLGAVKYRGWERSSVAQTIRTLEEANKAARPQAMPVHGGAVHGQPKEVRDAPSEPAQGGAAKAEGEGGPADDDADGGNEKDADAEPEKGEPVTRRPQAKGAQPE